MKGKFRLTVKCLLQNKLRFILTIISITIAVSSVLLISSVSSFGASALWAELDSLGMNGLIVSAGGTAISERDIEKTAQLLGVEGAAPVTVAAGKVFYEADKANVMTWGIDDRTNDVVSFELVSGRTINRNDVLSSNHVCMIDRTLAESLSSGSDILGKTIEVISDGGENDFTVVGVVKTGQGIMQSLMGSYFPAFLYAPYTAFDSDPDFTQVFIKTDGMTSSSSVRENVIRTMGDVTVADMAGSKGTLESMLGTITAVFTAIGCISLIVSGLSIMNIMLISVSERTREIGIKLSVGAGSGDIMLDFLCESVIISLTGAVLAILLSAAVAAAVRIVWGIGLTLTFTSIIISILASMLIGIVFGIFPAYKASHLKPVEALRS